MIRVLHVLPWITAGGVERRRAYIAEASEPSFEHRFFTLSAKGYNCDRIRDAGCVIDSVGMPRLRGVQPFVHLARVIRQYRPHIIHGAVFEGVTLAATMGRLMRVPVVIGEETSDATNRSVRGHALFRTLAMMTDCTVAISPQVVAKLRDVTQVPEYKIRLITNGVEPYPIPDVIAREHARSPFGLAQSDLVLGTMSRLVDDSHKRVSDVIRAMPAVIQTCPNAQLLVCGSGREMPMLEQIAEELGISQRVRFAGTVIPEQGFAAMDVYVHVAAREGFGLSVAEAAFCALPIVTTGVGGIAEIVQDGVNSVYVPVGAPEAIAASVVNLAQDAGLRARLGAAARERALARFSSQRYVRDIEALYRRLLLEKKVRV